VLGIGQNIVEEAAQTSENGGELEEEAVREPPGEES